MPKHIFTFSLTLFAWMCATLSTPLPRVYAQTADGQPPGVQPDGDVAKATQLGVYGTLGLPTRPRTLLTLGIDGNIYRLSPTNSALIKLPRPNYGSRQSTIGMDFRPADGKLYTITDTGNVVIVDVNTGATTRVGSTVTFAGGFQCLMDFNPVVDAVRLIGSNTQNYAVVNSGGNLNTVALQTSLAYAQGDVNFGKFPSIAAGGYTNKRAGAQSTLLYMLDYSTDSLVTIAGPLTANGSSNTGGGQLQTIGELTFSGGGKVKVDPLADLNVYTDTNGKNYLLGINNMTLLSIDLSQLNPNLQLGQVQKVTVRSTPLGGSFGVGVFIKMIDLAIQ